MALGLSIGGLEMFAFILIIAATVNMGFITTGVGGAGVRKRNLPK
jgi:hypothetical protein